MDDDPIYAAIEKGDAFDEKIWREGRYYISYERAREVVFAARKYAQARHRKPKANI